RLFLPVPLDLCQGVAGGWCPVCHGHGAAMPLTPAPCPPQEQAVALTLMFSSFLLPTAWVLSNIYYYRSRPE
uniref:Uncharacterized protein n=1 Tax=Serinus canaria TaxID=9135 RepID=A0A8C9N1N8_SERCA